MTYCNQHVHVWCISELNSCRWNDWLPVGEDFGECSESLLWLCGLDLDWSSWPVRLRERGTPGKLSGWPTPGRNGNLGKPEKGKFACFASPGPAVAEFILWSAVVGWSLDLATRSPSLVPAVWYWSNTDILQ